MKNHIFLILAILIIFLLISDVTAEITVDIKTEDSFSLNERTYFNYTMISTDDVLVRYVPHIVCEQAPISFLVEKEISVKKGISYKSSYKDIVVQDWFEPQNCTAYVQILSPIQKTVSKEFQIVTDPSFDFTIKLDKKIFLLNEDIYIDYSSSVESPTISVTSTSPDKTTQQINLPTTIKAEQIGTYTLDVIASKEGYKTTTTKEQFGVIEKEAEISSKEIGSFIFGTEEGKGKTFFIVFVIALILIIIFVIIILSKFIKNKHK